MFFLFQIESNNRVFDSRDTQIKEFRVFDLVEPFYRNKCLTDLIQNFFVDLIRLATSTINDFRKFGFTEKTMLRNSVINKYRVFRSRYFIKII